MGAVNSTPVFYTYIHRRESDDKPFYVGKGRGKRAWHQNKRNSYWRNTVAKHGLKVEICAYWATEEQAFEHEKFLIEHFRDLGMPLVNLTDGGEGTAGYKHGAKRLSYLKNNNPAKRPDIKAKISENRRGIPVLQNAKRRISRTMTDMWRDPEYKKRQSAAHVGAKHSQEHKNKISLALYGIKRSPETIQKMKLAALLREARKREQRGELR